MKSTRIQRWLRFIIGGGINTGFTYLVYLSINTFINYQLAYLVAYATGIVFSYCFNALVVFRVPLSWAVLFSYPVVYVLQYMFSALLLGGLIEYFGIEESVAPLFVVVLSIPFTYFMSKCVLSRGRQQPNGIKG